MNKAIFAFKEGYFKQRMKNGAWPRIKGNKTLVLHDA